MTQERSFAEIVKAMEHAYLEHAGFPAGDAADIGVRIKLLAGEIFSLSTRLQFIERQMFPATATGEYLEAHANMRGITRKEAGTALGELTFYRKPSHTAALADYDPMQDPALAAELEIPAGTICATAGTQGRQYVTTRAGVIAKGKTEVTVPAQANESGRAYNAAPEKICVMVNAPQGVSGVHNLRYFTGGGDRETDLSLRKRIEESFAYESNGANTEYYRQKALAFADVISANVMPRARGTGTVDVIIRTHQNAGEAFLKEVKRAIDENRELCCNTLVRYALSRPVDTDICITAVRGVDRDALATQCAELVKDYFDALEVGEELRLGVLTKLVLELEGVINCRFALPGDDITPPMDAYLKPGVTSVTVQTV